MDVEEIPGSSELSMLRGLARRFVDDELVPLEDDYRGCEYLPDAVLNRLRDRAKALGLWAIDVSKEDGGAGLGILANTIVSEELARSVVQGIRSPGPTGGSVGILEACRGAQRERYLVPVVRGEKTCSFALTESESGSDAFGQMRTKAVKDGDEWVITGTKLFISHASHADFVQVMALTDPGPPRSVTCFLVDRGTDGFHVAQELELMIPDRPAELVFDHCRVPGTQVLGGVGQGMQLANAWLGRNRIYHSAKCIGRALRALEIATEFARTRVSFGKALADRQAIQWMVADSVMEIHAARLVLYRAAARADAGDDVSDETPIAKVLCNESAWRTADRCLQILGSAGLSRESPVEQIFRELRSMRITEGATEIHRWRLARNVLREGRWPDVTKIATATSFE